MVKVRHHSALTYRFDASTEHRAHGYVECAEHQNIRTIAFASPSLLLLPCSADVGIPDAAAASFFLCAAPLQIKMETKKNEME